MYKIYLSMLFCMASSLWVSAQERTITGLVKDATGDAFLQGASVGIKNKKQTALTQTDGRFAIAAATGDVLIVSFVGYLTLEVKAADNLVILLKPTGEQLSEVIVTGALGIKRSARELGTASQNIRTQELNQARPVNPILGLASKVSGLRINMFDSKVDPDVQVNLRGIRSHNGNNAPLYVVDGVPVPDINRINPNDIESINVLKGANAAAVYGSDGVNGALMITTKKGRNGRQVINYTNTTLFESVMRLPDQQNEYGMGLNGVYNPTQYQSWGPTYDGSMKNVGGALPDGSQWQLPYEGIKDGRKDFFDVGMTTQNDISLSGGDERSTFFLSAQDVYTKGIVPGDKNRRTGARFNGTRKFGKLQAAYNINYVLNKNDITPSEPWSTVYRLPSNIPYGAVEDWQNNLYANPNYWFSTNQPNPYFNAANQRTETKQQTLNANVELSYRFAPWLNAIYRVGLYNRNAQSRATVGKFTYTTAGRTNIAGSVNDGSNDFRRLNSDLILNFEKTFGKFSTRLLVGNNIRTDETKAVNLSASALVVPDLFNPGNRTGELGGSSSITRYRQVAAYGEFTAGYDNFLFVTLTGRNEWVSVLNPDNQSYFYPGVSTSFIFTDAIKALKESKSISYGKVYASYNRTGNVGGLSPYALQNTYSQTNGFPFGNQPGYTLGTTYPNANLKPEFVTSFEIGTQLAFFNNRLNVEAAYVHSNSSDGIIQTTVPGSTGYAEAWANAFKVSNRVIELNVNGDVISKRNLRWNIGITATNLVSEVKEIYGELDRLFIFRQNYLVKGQPYNLYLFTDYRRDPQGRVIVDKTTGNPVATTELYNGGTGTPPWQLGFHTAFDFKGFHVGAQFDWRMGAIMYSEAANRMISDGTSPLTTQYDRQSFVIPNSVIETTDGKFEPNTTVKTNGDRNYWANFVGPVQSNYAVSADFFKLRELNIGYSIPARWLSGQQIVKNATVGLIGRNLFSIWNKANIYNDPEFIYQGGNGEGYLSWRHLPPTRMVGFNVQVGF
ncbi:SusC/RagA family TonB-linked outer membrane protein [Paraflavitalea pollutisoli]|uniref:SusC/RagA family TonB-linked outer membrane protein n=1 Tax=Paraflavitalea pollutisoli TaxID=3034143 RepID=UPI0023EC7188|nr:SusC/RagA family TonB-linked outer membrane protein [Paraflavitalea sp. H1-2-19X]